MKYLTVMVAGTFDHFHVGHQFLLWSAFLQADKLLIIVAHDDTVKYFKKKTPYYNLDQRIKRIQQEFLSKNNVYVQAGHINRNFDKTIKNISPNLLLLGYDQQFDEKSTQQKFPNIKFQRCAEYYPKIFKSSKF